MARTLEVRIADALAGIVIERSNGSFRFEYDPEYIERGARIPISHSMPISQRAHGTRAIGRWMWGLLPDNEMTLDRWAQRYKVSARNPMALLSAMGEDCPGAVQLTPPGFELAGHGNVRWITGASLEQRIATLLEDPGAGRLESDTGKFSLAGAQSKTALYRTERRWGVPRGRTPTTHILKPEGSRFPGLATNEHFCLQLARAAGVPAVESEVEVIGAIPTIIVRRFDRYRDTRDNMVKRIHQEDCCQALGVYPRNKYQSEGGPGVAEIMTLLHSSKAPDIDRERFMRAQAFNFVIGGTDAHAKNYAILYEPGGAFRLMPLYDVISFLPFHDRRTELSLAMTIGGRRLIDEINPDHWARAAKYCGFPDERAIAFVRDLVDKLPDLAASIRDKSVAEGLPMPFLERLVSGIADNAKRIERRFGALRSVRHRPSGSHSG